MTLLVTADELDALARRLGASRFPGVTTSLFDTVGAEHHRVLTDRLLATLIARGLVEERDSRLVAPAETAALLGPTLCGGIRYEIERTDPDARAVTALGAFAGLVVWHRADGLYHRFDAVSTDGDVARALVDLVDPAPGPAAGRPFRARHSALPSRLESLPDGWRATTTITQAAAPDGVTALSWVSIVDCGDGQVWLLEPDPDSPDDGLAAGDDPVLRATPVDPAGLLAYLTDWCGSAG
jgi:hypothetical protein